MKNLLTGIEIQSLFRITKNNLKKCREEGLTCEYLSGQYYYKYNDVVEFLK